MSQQDPAFVQHAGPVYKALAAIAKLPADQQFAALLERLDAIDEDERTRQTVSKSGNVHRGGNNFVRIAVAETGKKWIEEENAKGGAGVSGKLGGLGVFRKAG